MKKSLLSVVNGSVSRTLAGVLMFVSLAFMTELQSFAQPSWFPANPTVGTVGPITIPVNYGITTTGTVYIIVLNYNNPSAQDPSTVRGQAITPTAPGIVFNAVLPVTAGQENTALQVIANNLASGTYHTIYIVAANASGTLMATSVRLNATTLACPDVMLFTFFGNLGECVNLGAQGMYQVSPLGAIPTGVLAGTTFTVDWGDGSIPYSYTSGADNDLPPVQTHDFDMTLDCAYQGTWVVTNPCNEFAAGTNIFVIHGRDDPEDGDGLLQMAETITGDVDITYVCEGVEHNIVLQDVSTWNCQDPDVPPPLNPADYDNESARTIQFVYGETPAGAIMNNIDGNVTIGGSGIANSSNGVVGPVLGPFSPPNPGTLTDVINIPATADAGQRFYVYLKDWNKCNPFVDEDLDYVYRQFIIEVIDAPPAPGVVTPQNFCYSATAPTLTATLNLSGDTLVWYDDAMLTNLLYVGNNFPTGITAPGTYDFYVRERSGVNGCESPAARIDMIIREQLSAPGAISGPTEVCINATNQVFSVAANPPTMPFGGTTEYFWTLPAGWSFVSGQGSREITVNIGGTAGSRNISVVNRYTTAPQCPSSATTFSVTVSPLSVGGNVTGGTTPLCLGNSTGNMTLSGYTGTIQRWESRLLPSATWTTISNTTTTYNATPSSTGTWEYRAVVRSGSCAEAPSGARQIVVSPLSVGGTTSGGNSPICLGSSTGNITVSGYTGTITRWQRRYNNGTWSNISSTGGVVTYSTTPGAAGTYDYRAQITSSPCSSAYSTFTTIVVDAPSAGGSVTGGTTPICLGFPTGTMTLSGHTGSVVRWQRRVNGGAWSMVANTNTTYSETPPLVGTWEYRAEVQNGACASAVSGSVTLVVVPTTVSGTISGGSTPICPGISTGTLTLSGYTGSIIQWEKRVNAGTWTIIANTNDTYSEIPTSSGTWEYRVLVQSIPCAAVYSPVRTIVVRPQFNAQLHDDASICNNSSVNFNVVISAGTSPYTINYTRNGAGQAPVGGYTSGSNISTGVLTTGTYTYALTSVTDANGCLASNLGTPITVDVGSSPTAVVVSGSGNVCDGASSSWIRFDITGGAGPYTIGYSVNGTVQTPISGYIDGSNHNLGMLAVGTYNYQVTSVTDVCGGSIPVGSLPGPYPILVSPIPSASGTTNNLPTICNNGTTDIILQSTVASSDFIVTVSNSPAVSWVSGKAPAGGTILNGNGTSITQNLEHTSTVPTNVTYTITPRGPTGCLGSPVTRTVVVNPTAQVNQPSNVTACNGSATTAVTFSTVNTVGTTTYGWTNNTTSINLPSSGSGNIPSFTAANTGSSPVVATIVVTPTFIYGSLACTGPTKTFTITVNPSGQVNDPSDQVLCHGATTAAVNFSTNRSGGATTYSWSNNNTSIGLAASGTGNISSFTASNTTNAPVTATITVTPSFEGCAGTPQTFTITVNPAGQVNDPSDQVRCNGAATAAVNFSTSRTGGTSVFNWSNNNSSIGLGASGTGNIASFNAINNGTVPVTATITVTPSFEGCAGTPQSFTITVNPSGQVNDPSDQVRCVGSTTAAVNFSTDRTGGSTTYSWSNNNTSIGLGASGTGNIPSFTTLNTGNTPAVATITVTPSFEGCAGTPQSFTITVNPSGQVNDPADQVKCNGVASDPVNFATIRSGGASTYSWTNNNTSIGLGASGSGNIPSFTLNNGGTAAVTATITVTPYFEGCAGSVQTFTITVNPTPSLSTTLTPSGVCSNTLFTYTPNSATSGTTYTWSRGPIAGITPATSSGTGSISETLRNQTSATIPVVYAYTLTANGCSNTQNVTVNILPEPVISDQTVSVCSGETLLHHILLDNFVNPGANVTFTWPSPTLSGGLTGGTARSIPSPDDMSDSFLNISGGPETATYTVSPTYNGCAGAPRDIVVTVGSQPVLDPNLNLAVCSSVPTGLMLQVDATSSPASSYTVVSSSAHASLGIIKLSPASPGVAADYLSTDSFTNVSGAPLPVTYVVRPVFGATCIGDPVTIVVTIRPEPVIQPGQTQTICSRVAASKEIYLVPANQPSGTTFSWPVPVMSAGAPQGTAASGVPADPAGIPHLTDIFENYGTTPITATYTVTPVNSGCSGAVRDVIITINPEPAAPPITGRDLLCVGETNLVYSVPLHPGSTYTWYVAPEVGIKTFDFNSNAIIVDAAAVANAGIITAYEINSYLCHGNADTLDVNVVAPSVIATVAGDNTACALETKTYSVPAHTGSVYSWTLPAGAALVGDPMASSITVTFGTNSGNITVRETNAAGCITNHNPLTVTVHSLPSANISNSGTICVEGTHTVNITLTGAFPWNVVYAINGTAQPSVPVASSPYAMSVNTPGTYTIVSVTDANLCSAPGTGAATVSNYPVPTATISGTSEMCPGGSRTITISLTGAAPFTFAYTDGTTTVPMVAYPSPVYTFNVSPATTTTYTLTSLTDNHGCIGTLSGNAVITVNPLPVISLAGTNPLCNGDSNGSIDLTVSSGTPGYNFSWTGPAGYISSADDISGLVAGYYAVSVSDSKGCSATASTTLTQPAALSLGNSGNIALSCNGDVNGSGTFTATGGTLPYDFDVLTNTSLATTVEGGTTVSITNAAAGTIVIRVTDAHGCTAQSTMTVTEPSALGLSAVLSHSIEGSHNINCFNGNTGSIVTSVTGGIIPYSYSWSTPDGSGLVAGAANQSGLTDGTYNLTVTDANGCTITGSWTLTEPPQLISGITADDILIGTCSDAQLTATVSGGVMPVGGYIYSWTPAAGLSNANIANPVASPTSTTTYTLTATDANSCTTTSSILISVAPLLTASAFADDNVIGTCSDAQLDVNVTGGEAPYSYSWAPATGLNFTNIKAPVATPAVTTTYTVTVTDANGCIATSNVTITVTSPLLATAAVDDDPIGTCPTSVAHLSTTVTGGEAPYTYLWDNAGTIVSGSAFSTNPTVKPSGSTLYTVTVTDVNGCQTTATVMVNVAPALTVIAGDDDDIIGECPTSVANLWSLASGGELPLSGEYIYNWTPAAGLNYTNVANPIAKPAVTTTYTVTITDRNGCTATDDVTITVSDLLVPTVTPFVYAGGYNISCHGNTDGSIDLSVTGGEAPYSYSWIGPGSFTAITQDVSGLIAGTYQVTITDANNCYTVTTATLIEPATLIIGKTPDVMLACYGDVTATGSFSVSGGTAPYILSTLANTAGATVTLASPSASFTGGGAGQVTIGVVDANNCTAQTTILINQPPQLLPGSVNGDQEVCYQGNPGALNEVTAPSGGPSTIIFQWERSTDGGGTWNAITGANMAAYDPPAGIDQTTWYRRGSTSGSCDTEYSNIVIVTVNPLPVASISGTGLVCPGDAATVAVTVTTGEAPFTVVLSDGTSVAWYTSGNPITVNPVTTTTYTINSITDNNGCLVTAPHANLTGSATITTKVVPEIISQPTGVTVCEGDAAVFTVNAGLTTNPAYQWYVNTGSGMNPLPGETGASLSLTASSSMNGYRYQVVVSGDCTPDVTSDIVLLTVNELPEIVNQPANASLCSGENAVFTVDAGVTTNPTYQWFVYSGGAWLPAVGARYQGSATNTLTVVSVIEAMSGYQYMVRVSGACNPYVESIPVTLTVTRQAEITEHPSSIAVCEGSPATFTVNAGLTTNPSYQWERSTDGGTTWNPISGATSSTYTIASAGTADNGTAYRAVVSSTCGSSLTSLRAYLTVNELPEIVDQPDNATVCEYTIADFVVDAGVTAGVTYRWQISTDSGGNWNNLSESATYFGTSSMNLKVNGALRTMSGYQFRVIISGTCTPSVTSSAVTLTVNTVPEIITQPDPSEICENNNTSFSVSALGTGTLSYQWYVDTGGGSGFVALSDGGVYSGTASNSLVLTSVPRTYDNYRYRVTIAGDCPPIVTSSIVQLDVSIETVINTQPHDSTICEFMTAGFSALADGANLKYQWQVYDGTGWADLTNTGLYVGVQTPMLMVFGPPRSMDGTRYRVVIRSDCSADITSGEAVMHINTAPALTDYPDEFKGCPGGSATFSVVAEGSDLHYQWQVNSGTGFNDVTDGLIYSGSTTEILTINNLTLAMNGYLVRVVVSGSCQPSLTSPFAPLRVYNEPTILTQPADAEVCDQSGVIFYAQVFTTGAGETTVWQVNDGVSGWTYLADNTQYQGTQTTYLAIMNATTSMNGWHYRLEITGPCGVYHTSEPLLTVHTPPVADIAATDTILVCGGVPTQLHGNPTGGSGSYTQHRWYGDVGPLSKYNIENPVFNTAMTGYYRLIYQVTDSKGCVGLDTVVVEVEKPVAMFTADNSYGCQPLTVTFTNTSSGYASVLWNFGDGSTSTEVSLDHTYPNPSTSLLYYDVRLDVTSSNGCVSSMTSPVTVYPEISSDFTISDDTVCSGDNIMFTTLPGAFRYYWIYGDGQAEYGSNVIDHIYVNTTGIAVPYNVTLRTESFFNCTSETTYTIVVYPKPTPLFTADPVSQTEPNSTVTFTNNTVGGPWTWLWRFGDGNTSGAISPVYTYSTSGTFAVTLLVSNGVCADSVRHNVSILPALPVPDFDSIPSGCAPWSITLHNTSQYATSYYWDFGDGHSSTLANPSYTYLQSGVFEVTLTATGPGGSRQRSRIVHVYPSPQAYFEVSPAIVYVNDEKVRLFNLSGGADYFIWEFGDGDTSHVRDPFHKYTEEGIYDITLHAYSNNGCYDTYVLSPAVTVQPFGDLIFATVFKPNPDGPIEVSELPSSGDAVDQFFYPPIRETVINYHLQIFNRWGVLIFESYDINKPWNGYYRNKRCPQGVYVWLVEGKYANGRPFKKAGDITLLH